MYQKIKNKEDKIICTWIKNSLDPEGSALSTTSSAGEFASDYIKSFVGDSKVAASINGILIDLDVCDPILNKGDHLCFCIYEDDEVLSAIAALALIVVAPYLAPALGYAYTIAAYAVGGYLLINSIAMPDIPTAPSVGGETGSQNYGFVAGSNEWREGGVVPSLIGERWFSPPRIAAQRYLPPSNKQRDAESIVGVIMGFVSTALLSVTDKSNQDQQHLRTQYLLTSKTIDEITEDDILINGKPFVDYNGAKFEYSPGEVDETNVSSLVPSVITEQQINANLSEVTEDHSSDHEIKLTQSASSTYTIEEDINHIVITLEVDHFGITYYASAPYNLRDRDSTYELHVEYAIAGSGSWTEVVFTASEIVGNNYSFHSSGSRLQHDVAIYDLATDTYDVRFWYEGSHGDHDGHIVNIKAYAAFGGQNYSTNGTEITRVGIGLLFSQGLYYFDDNGNVQDHSVTVLVRLRPYGESDWTHIKYHTFTEATTKPFRRFLEFNGLDADQYEVAPMISGILPTDVRYKHNLTFEFMQEGVDYVFSYPDCAILSLDIPAIESLQQRWPVIQVKAKRTNYTSARSSSNPAWASYYRMIDIYGVDSENIPLAKWQTWADFCDTNNLTVSYYLDTPSTMRTVLDIIGQAGRATIVSRGKSWDVIIDTQSSAKHTFGSDNIIPGTFKQKWLPLNNRANSINAYFFDKNNYNLKTPVKIVHPNVDDGTDEEISRDITLWGVDSKEQAIQISISMLNQTQLIRRELSWESFIDTIDCKVGDVAFLQHNEPEWGYAPGRIIIGNSSYVTCDLPVDFDDEDNSSRDFRILVRHQLPRSGETEDFIEVLPIVNPYPNTGVVTYTLDGEVFERVPERGSLVLIGWVTGTEESTENEKLSTKKVLVTGIERSVDKKFKVSALDYYDDMFITDYVVVEDPESESGLTPTNLYGGTSWSVEGKVRKNHIELLWTGGNAANTYYIFYKVNTGSGFGNWLYYGETQNTNGIQITDLPPGNTYRFSIATERTPDSDNTYDITFNISDFVDNLSAVTNLQCKDTGNTTWDAYDLDLIWDEITLFTIDHYRVEILNSQNVIVRTDKIEAKKPNYLYTYDMNIQDHGGIASTTVYVRVIAVDDLGNEVSTGNTLFTNNPPSTPTSLITAAGSDSEFIGRDLDVKWGASPDEDVVTYKVTITHGGIALRTEYVNDTRFKYTYRMNQEDSGLTVTTTTTTTSTVSTTSTSSSTSSSTTSSTTSSTASSTSTTSTISTTSTSSSTTSTTQTV